MASTVTDICNRALARIGVTEYIDSIDDTSEEAITCNLFYATSRDACLAAFPWPFATLRKSLAVLTNEPTRDGWRKVYALPNDCLKVRKLWPAGLNMALFNAYPFTPGQVPPITMNPRSPISQQRIPFEIEKSSLDDSKVLLCDLDTVVLFYTALVEDTSQFPQLFMSAVECLMASEMAMPLVKDPKRAALALQAYKTKLQEAQVDAFTDRQEDQVPDSEMVTGRL